MDVHDQLQAIHQIAEALSSRERFCVFYLCDILDAENSVTCLKEKLNSTGMCCESFHLFLKELMLHLRRFDILRRVYKSSRDEVERALKHKQVLPPFRVLMVNINDNMAYRDLSSMKFLLSSKIPHEKMDDAKSFLDVIIEMEKEDLVSPERVDSLEECLRNIDRVDLAKKVTAYKMSAATCEGHSSHQRRDRVTAPFPTPNSSHPVQCTRHAESHHIENIPLSVYKEQSQLDRYKFTSNPRAVCVIIDCVGNDGDMLEQTFKALHFSVVLYKWLNANDTLAALRGLSRQNLEGDGFVCCIISRGTENHLLGTDSYGVGLRLDDVRSLFTADECPMLAGKPKLFFIQRYSVPECLPHARRVHRDEELETDGFDGLSRCDFIPNDADVFWSHCWTHEFQLEQGHHRSFYLRALTDVLRRGQKRNAHLVDVHTEVNGAIFEHNKSNPGAHYFIDVKHTLRKELYLH